VDLSGIIFVLLAVAWAVFLIPKALRHHDEAARTRPIDRFSTSVRVVAHREPVNDRDTRLVVTPARTTVTASAASAASTAGSPAPKAAAATEPAAVDPALRVPRAAARAAARRRRRILGTLLLCDVVVTLAAYLGHVPVWSVAVPGGLTLAYLVLCRTQVRHEAAVDVAAPVRQAPAPAASAPEAPATEVPGETPVDVQLAVAVDVHVEERAVPEAGARVDEHGVADFDDTEETVGLSVEALRAAVLPAGESGTLWDPLPVTLPTYVTKAKASRTVRTIDLGEPGTWTSGHDTQDTDLAAQAADAQAATEAGPVDGDVRAVGS
jgi:hypothetical protein